MVQWKSSQSVMKRKAPKTQKSSPQTLMEGVGQLFALVMLLLRGLAIGAICYFIYRYIEPLIH